MIIYGTEEDELCRKNVEKVLNPQSLEQKSHLLSREFILFISLLKIFSRVIKTKTSRFYTKQSIIMALKNWHEKNNFT